MPNPLQSYVNTTRASAAYQTIKQQLGHDRIIFLAMKQVSQRRDFVFDLPVSPTEYPQKHQEIEQSLTRYQALLNRQGLFFELIEEIQSQLIVNGREIYAERLRDLIVLETNQDFKIRLSADGAWLVEWVVTIDVDGNSDTREIFAVIYERTWKHIVPWPVVQYLNSGILLYKQKAYVTALVLMSIAVEATLRDVLSTKGYSFTHSASKVDIYRYSQAQVNASGTGYTLSFLDPMPKSPAIYQRQREEHCRQIFKFEELLIQEETEWIY